MNKLFDYTWRITYNTGLHGIYREGDILVIYCNFCANDSNSENVASSNYYNITRDIITEKEFPINISCYFKCRVCGVHLLREREATILFSIYRLNGRAAADVYIKQLFK